MTIKLPTISIVTPSFNQAEYLEETINSVLSQNYPNLQYVVIDGGSTDGSAKIIKKYQKHLSHWESKPDRGQSHAINKGFSHTTGEIMGWINSDDILRPGALQLIGSIMAQFKQVDWLTCLPSTMSDKGHLLYLARPPLYVSSLIKNGWYVEKLLGFIMQEGTYWRRPLWDKAGGAMAEVEYSMDYKLWQSFANYAKLYCVNAGLASYRLNPNRKNNDHHKGYYQEINQHAPPAISYAIKLFWKVFSRIVSRLNLSQSFFYDEQEAVWKFRKSLFKVERFQLLGNVKP